MIGWLSMLLRVTRWMLYEGTLSGVFNAAIYSVCDIKFGSTEDIERLKAILKDKYNLLLTSDTHLEIEEIPTRK